LLTEEIKKILCCSDQKVLIITIGNTLRSDDGIGPYIAENLKILPDNLKLLNAFDRPESIIDQAVSMSPEKTIIIDAANFSGIPGEARLIANDAIPESSLSTHTFPLKIIARILEEDTGSKVFFLGIQAKSAEFKEELSQEVKQTGDEIIAFLTNMGTELY
jgi:hydrogenase 3 maturation protease